MLLLHDLCKQEENLKESLNILSALLSGRDRRGAKFAERAVKMIINIMDGVQLSTVSEQQIEALKSGIYNMNTNVQGELPVRNFRVR